MSIIRETKWALLELFPDQKATEADAETAAREKLIADAKAQAEAEAEKTKAGEEAAADAKSEKKPLSAVDQAAEDLAAVNLVPEKKAADTAEAAAADPEEAEAEPESDDPPVSLEPEDKRPNGVMVRDYAARGYHIDVLCAPDQVVAAAEMLNEHGFTLEAVTGVDWIKEEEMEVVYDYSRTDGQLCRVAVRARLPRSNPEIPTISEVYPGANWHERETHEFFGIRFLGHPYLVPLLLPEDADFHPLLKDFTP